MTIAVALGACAGNASNDGGLRDVLDADGTLDVGSVDAIEANGGVQDGSDGAGVDAPQNAPFGHHIVANGVGFIEHGWNALAGVTGYKVALTPCIANEPSPCTGATQYVSQSASMLTHTWSGLAAGDYEVDVIGLGDPRFVWAGRIRATALATSDAGPAPDATTDGGTVAGPFNVGIDGGYALFSTTQVAQRMAFGAAWTRHEFSMPTLDASAFFAQARSIPTHVLCLLSLGGGAIPSDPTAYASWVQQFVTMWGPDGTGDCTYFEILNEPYIYVSSGGVYSPGAYAQLYKAAVIAGRAASARARFLIAGETTYWSNGGANDGAPWVDPMFTAVPDLGNYIDYVTSHPYGHDPATCAATDRWCFNRIETIRSEFVAHGVTAPFWITEVGDASSPDGTCDTEANQARDVGEHIDLARGFGWVQSIFVYQLVDQNTTGGTNCELHYGLIHSDGTFKPAYSVVQMRLTPY